MKTKLINSFQVENTEDCLCKLFALDSTKAAGLIYNFEKKEYFICEFNHRTSVRRSINKELKAIKIYKKDCRVEPIMFRTKNGFGILIQEYLYFLNYFFELKQEININNIPRSPEKHSKCYKPIKIYDFGNNQFGVTFSLMQAEPIHFSILEINDTNATYLFQPKEFSFDIEVPSKFSPEIQLRFKTRSSIIIQSICCLENTIITHTIGPDTNWYKYGLDFSMLSSVANDNLLLTAHKDILKGFGNFSSDKKWLLLHSLSNKKKLNFYQISGKLEAKLSLAANKNLGFLDSKFLHADVFEESLWLYNAKGATLSEIKFC